MKVRRGGFLHCGDGFLEGGIYGKEWIPGRRVALPVSIVHLVMLTVVCSRQISSVRPTQLSPDMCTIGGRKRHAAVDGGRTALGA